MRHKTLMSVLLAAAVAIAMNMLFHYTTGKPVSLFALAMTFSLLLGFAVSDARRRRDPKND